MNGPKCPNGVSSHPLAAGQPRSAPLLGAIFGSGQGSRRAQGTYCSLPVRASWLPAAGGWGVARNKVQGPSSPARFPDRFPELFAMVDLPCRKHERASRHCLNLLCDGTLTEWAGDFSRSSPQTRDPLLPAQQVFSRNKCLLHALNSRNSPPRWRSNSPCPGLTHLGIST